LVQNARNKLTGDYVPVNQNSMAFAPSAIVSDTTQGIKKGMGAFGQFMTDVGLSIGHMATMMPFGQTATLFVLSSEAAGQTAYQALQNGATTDKAFAVGTFAGLVEYMTEKLPLEHLFSAAKRSKAVFSIGSKRRLYRPDCRAAKRS
jgi:hypothetical protein